MTKIGRNDKCPCGSDKKYKKCCMGRGIKKMNVYDTLSKYFGESWINDQLGKIKRSGFKDLNPMNLASAAYHPVIKAILQTQEKLYGKKNKERYEKYGVPLGAAEAFQNQLANNLASLDQDISLEPAKRRLRDKNEFEKIEYELTIAAGYKRLGYKVDFIEKTDKKRTGEFYVTDGESKVLVECKKKDIQSEKGKKISSWWEEFQHLMMKKLKSAKKNYGIIVKIPEGIDKKDTHNLIKEISNLVDQNFEGSVVLMNKYEVQIKKFCEAGGSIKKDEEEAYKRECTVGSFSCLQKKDEWPVGDKPQSDLRDPVFVGGIHPEVDFDQRIKSVIATLDSAYGQTEEDIPNIIYINVTTSPAFPEISKALLEKSKVAIKNKIETDFSKISAVILTNIHIEPYGEHVGIHAEQEVIINNKAKNQIPKGFKILGNNAHGRDLLKDISDSIFFN